MPLHASPQSMELRKDAKLCILLLSLSLIRFVFNCFKDLKRSQSGSNNCSLIKLSELTSYGYLTMLLQTNQEMKEY